MMLEGRVEVCGTESRYTGMRRGYAEDGRWTLATGVRYEAGVRDGCRAECKWVVGIVWLRGPVYGSGAGGGWSLTVWR